MDAVEPLARHGADGDGLRDRQRARVRKGGDYTRGPWRARASYQIAADAETGFTQTSDGTAIRQNGFRLAITLE